MRFGRPRLGRRQMRKYVAPEPTPLPSITHMVDEGVMIVTETVAMKVKNYALVHALRHDRDYDTEKLTKVAAAELDTIATEQSGYADRMVAELTAVRKGTHEDRDDAWNESQHGYRTDDLEILQHRRDTYRGVAMELGKLRDNPEYLASLVSQAREKLWGEVSNAISARLDTQNRQVTGDPEYVRTREERMRSVQQIDLKNLEEGRALQRAREELGDY